MSIPAEQRSPEPGLHVRTDAAPGELAATLARELDGDLCTSAHQAEALLAKLQALPALTSEAIELLTERTARLAAVQRVVDRTLERATAEVGARLSTAGAGVAIHPSAVRERAAAVVAARAAQAGAEAAFTAVETAAELAARQRVPEPALAMPVVPPAAHLSEPPPRRRRFFNFLRRHREPEIEDTSESTSLLQQVAASTDEVFGARRASAAREDQLILLRAERDRAEEDVRVAERAWHDLAGDDPVEDVEEVVRRFDPQHQDAMVVARDTLGVRAAMTLLERARERWEEGWRSSGFDPPPSADEGGLAQTARRLSQTVVLVGAAVDSAELLAMAAPAAAVVAVEPG